MVIRYLVWYCSTSGVDQNFSTGDRLGVERPPTSQITESLSLRAVFDNLSANEMREVFKRAQELFADGCPKTRTRHNQSRQDKGTEMLSTTK
ncbi:MAG: hypothetical protein ACKPKO_58560, partial [Candidatus Fonsibacter sp.]